MATDLGYAKQQKKQHLQFIANEKRAILLSGTTIEERQGWTEKHRQALAYNKSLDVADAPALNAEAIARGVTITEIVNRVTANANALLNAEAAIAGTEGKHKDIIDALGDPNLVDAYDAFLTDPGWPV